MLEHDPSPAGARFAVQLPGQAPMPDVFALWEVAPEPVAGMAFALDDPTMLSASSVDAVTWRVDLPADVQQAQQALAAQISQAAQFDQALNGVETRLTTFMQQQVPGGVVSFALDAPRPEQSLAMLLQTATQPVSFAPDDPQQAALATEAQAAQNFLGQVQQMLAAFAQIDTAIDAQLLARTRVGWTGDFDTVWVGAQTAAARQQHADSVTLALTTRALWVRFGGQVLTGALNIGRWLAVPGGGVMALPAVWRFINEMLDEYRHVKQVTRSNA